MTHEGPTESNGVILSVAGERRFVPAALAREIAEQPLLTSVPGSDLSLAVISGRVVAVVELSGQGPHALVCELRGDAVALAGVTVLSAGFFTAADDGVLFDGQPVPPLDVEAEVRLRDRAARAVSSEAP